MRRVILRKNQKVQELRQCECCGKRKPDVRWRYLKFTSYLVVQMKDAQLCSECFGKLEGTYEKLLYEQVGSVKANSYLQKCGRR